MAFWHKLLGGDKTEDTLEQIQKNLSDGSAVMLDVRSPSERQAIHLKDSIFIPFSQVRTISADSDELNQLPKDKIVYCH